MRYAERNCLGLHEQAFTDMNEANCKLPFIYSKIHPACKLKESHFLGA
jgi:hypothetical protein